MSRVPSFITADTTPPPHRRGEWIAFGILGLLLLAQLFALGHAQLASTPRWRPLIVTSCKLLGCTVPPWHEPAAFTMLSRDVIAVPEHPGVLRVQASFRNEARWAQAWPILHLTLSDASGRVLGARSFQPHEYRGKHNAAAELAPGQATQIAFDIAEPAPTVVAFDFRFE